MQRHDTAEFDDLQRLHHPDAFLLQQKNHSFYFLCDSAALNWDIGLDWYSFDGVLP